MEVLFPERFALSPAEPAPAHLLPDKMSALEKSQLQHVSHGLLSPMLQSQPYILLLIRSQCAVLLNDAP